MVDCQAEGHPFTVLRIPRLLGPNCMVRRARRVLAHLRMDLVDSTPHIRCQDVLIFQLARIARCAGNVLF